MTTAQVVDIRFRATIAEFQQGMRRMSSDAEASSAKIAAAFGRANDKSASELTRSARKAADAWQGAVQRIQASAGVLTSAVTLPVAGLAAALTVAAGGFEKQLNVLAAVAGTTSSEFAALRNQALTLGQNSIFSAGEVAEAQTELAKLGASVSEVLKLAPQVISLATVAGTKPAEAAGTALAIVNGFGLGVDQLAQKIDVLTKASLISAANLGDLSGSFKFVGSAARTVGQDFDELTGALALLSKGGIDGFTAGTSLRQILLRLAAPTGAIAKKLADLNVETHSADGSFRGLAAVLRDFERAGAQVEDFAEIFDLQAVTPFATLLASGSAELELYTKTLKTASAGTADFVAAAQFSGLSGQIENLKGAFETLLVKIGDAGILTALTNIVRGLGDFVAQLGATHPAIIQFGATVAVIGAAIGPVVFAVAGLGLALKGLAAFGPILAAGATLVAAKLAVLGVSLKSVTAALGAMRIASLAALGAFGPLILVIGGLVAAFIAFDKVGKTNVQVSKQLEEAEKRLAAIKGELIVASSERRAELIKETAAIKEQANEALRLAEAEAKRAGEIADARRSRTRITVRGDEIGGDFGVSSSNAIRAEQNAARARARVAKIEADERAAQLLDQSRSLQDLGAGTLGDVRSLRLEASLSPDSKLADQLRAAADTMVADLERGLEGLRTQFAGAGKTGISAVDSEQISADINRISALIEQVKAEAKGILPQRLPQRLPKTVDPDAERSLSIDQSTRREIDDLKALAEAAKQGADAFALLQIQQNLVNQGFKGDAAARAKELFDAQKALQAVQDGNSQAAEAQERQAALRTELANLQGLAEAWRRGAAEAAVYSRTAELVGQGVGADDARKQAEAEIEADRAIRREQFLREQEKEIAQAAAVTAARRQSDDAAADELLRQQLINEELGLTLAQIEAIVAARRSDRDANSAIDNQRERQQAFRDSFTQVEDTLANAFAGALTAAANGDSFGRALKNAFTNAIANLGSNLISQGVSAVFGALLGGILPTGGGGGASIPGRAIGGPVTAGRPYIVGERRPELFVPNVSGRIVPRVPDMSGGGRGGAAQISMPITINAPGADSAALARVEAQVVQLQRSIPSQVRSVMRDDRLRNRFVETG